MSDFLENLASRSFEPASLLQPRVPARFEPTATQTSSEPARDVEEVDSEFGEPAAWPEATAATTIPTPTLVPPPPIDRAAGQPRAPASSQDKPNRPTESAQQTGLDQRLRELELHLRQLGSRPSPTMPDTRSVPAAVEMTPSAPPTLKSQPLPEAGATNEPQHPPQILKEMTREVVIQNSTPPDSTAPADSPRAASLPSPPSLSEDPLGRQPISRQVKTESVVSQRADAPLVSASPAAQRRNAGANLPTEPTADPQPDASRLSPAFESPSVLPRPSASQPALGDPPASVAPVPEPIVIEQRIVEHEALLVEVPREPDVIAAEQAAPVPPVAPLSEMAQVPHVEAPPAPLATTEAPPPQPTINVTIGRVEVRGAPAPSVAAPATRAAPKVMGLDEYLRARTGAAP